MTVSLITGSSRGIGRATAEKLAALGHHVIVTSRDADAAAEAARAIVEAGGRARGLQLDVTDAESVRRAAADVTTLEGRLDVLVNNAGVLPEATGSASEAVGLDLFRETFGTNVFGAVAVLEAFLPLVRASSAGRIVNLSTRMGSLTDQLDPASPYFGMVVPAYQSSKAAVNNITIALSKSLDGTPVKVTSVCPGFVRTELTPMNADAPTKPGEAADVVVRAATLPDDAESGTFVDAGGVVPW